ncbi:ABC transporter permease subunit [Lysinibacter cavernae]|uniref:Peptide/nickel transport system permease protein n=1 Tax=Lysinibacter cavernae TaxID=1640652 RepID=A0A7X5TTT6_9MICO|nr:peptide/nickel transport system permease protein [Lysinibacter cavernae]
MTRFLVVRLLNLLLGLVVASAVIFVTLRILPGDVAAVIAGSQASPARVEAIRESLGLNRPLLVQYWDWVAGLFRLDLGNSVVTGTPVAAEITQKMQVTLPLAGLSLLIGGLIAFPLGILAAIWNRRVLGRLITVVSITAAAVPVVWGGLMLIAIFSGWLGVLPSQGFPIDGWSDPARAFRSLLLPALTIGLIEGAVLLRFVRSATLSALGADHVRTAAARGLTKTKALITHGLPVVGLSLVSILGLQVAALVVGAVVVEQLFNLPGIGRMLVVDVGNRDLSKVQSEILVITAIILVVGTLIDIAHRIIDPRQLQAEAEAGRS